MDKKEKMSNEEQQAWDNAFGNESSVNSVNENSEYNNPNERVIFTNNYNRIIKPNSMFMTEMNFLVNDKNKINNKNSMKKSREIRNINYDFFSFKELLKHIENDKKKIIDNQNDLDKMIKTTKDTYFEIWKYNHH